MQHRRVCGLRARQARGIRSLSLAAFGLSLLIAFRMPAFAQAKAQIIPQLPSVPMFSASTIPPNGDVNPYGVAVVPGDIAPGGMLHAGDILVSNFNNSPTTPGGGNLQGTGTTIVRVAPDGTTSLFFQGPQGLGLTTALGVLSQGFVLVGNVPTMDGTSATIQPTSLLIIDKNGNLVGSLSDSMLLNGPWDLTINQHGTHAAVFVSNVLDGTVTRVDLKVPPGGNPVVVAMTRIASGYLHRPDPAALVVGPTGLAYDSQKDILYVASTGDNAIFAIAHARHTQGDNGMGVLIYQDAVHLHGPLGLVRAPNGDLLTSNGDAINPDPTQPSEIVEFTPAGQFIAQFSVNSSGQGAAFGIALTTSRGALVFAAVDDINNAVDVWTIPLL